MASRPQGYVLPASWPGGEVRWAGDGTKGGGMVVAPFGLHATGARYEPLNQLRPAEFPGSLLDHLVGRHADSGDAHAEGR